MSNLSVEFSDIPRRGFPSLPPLILGDLTRNVRKPQRYEIIRSGQNVDFDDGITECRRRKRRQGLPPGQPRRLPCLPRPRSTRNDSCWNHSSQNSFQEQDPSVPSETSNTNQGSCSASADKAATFRRQAGKRIKQNFFRIPDFGS